MTEPPKERDPQVTELEKLIVFYAEAVLDAAEEGYRAVLLIDAVRGVEKAPGDSSRAVEEMVSSGAGTITFAAIDTEPAQDGPSRLGDSLAAHPDMIADRVGAGV